MDGLMEFQDFMALISKVETQGSLFKLGALLAKHRALLCLKRSERKRDVPHQPPPPSQLLSPSLYS